MRLLFLSFLVSLSLGASSVVDEKNSLVWQDNIDVSKLWFDHSKAISYCKSLKLNNRVWRLPTIDELETIVDKSKSPSLKSGFQYGTTGSYWTSTDGMTRYKQSIYFENGLKTSHDISLQNRVRCVSDLDSKK
jgi:hypothetical protein